MQTANIFLQKRDGKFPHVLLGDFGLACVINDEAMGQFAGTPPYTAPERNRGSYDYLVFFNLVFKEFDNFFLKCY